MRFLVVHQARLRFLNSMNDVKVKGEKENALWSPEQKVHDIYCNIIRMDGKICIKKLVEGYCLGAMVP